MRHAHSRYRCCRAFLGRHRLAKRRLGDRVRAIVLFCCFRRKAIWPTAELSHSRSASPVPWFVRHHQIRVLPALRRSRPFAPPWVSSSYRPALQWPEPATNAATAVLTAMAFNVMPLLAPTNQMSYDTAQFYNSALAIVVGCGVAPLAFRLLPPLSPALRARRLLALTSRDLRRLAIAPVLPRPDYWESRMYAGS
jgi:hypothetical protein